MKLKTEIFLLLFLTGLSVIVVTGALYYHNAKRSTLLHIQNHLESVSEAKQLRLEAMLVKKQEELEQLQNNTQLKQRLGSYLQELRGSDSRLNESTRILLLNQISRAVSDHKSLKNIHIADSAGSILVTTDPALRDKNLAYFECFQKALQQQTTSHAYMHDSIPYLCLSGPLYLMKTLLGVLIVEMELEDLPTITGDYTGLGSTGETTLAQRLSDTSAFYLTALRFQPKSSLIEYQNANLAQASFAALSGKEKFLPEVQDYRKKQVIASIRLVNQTGWGLVTKMDLEEAMVPVKEFLTMSLRIALIAMVVLAIVALVFAYKIVQPINSISEAAKKISGGDLLRQVKIHKKNELGNLASCFNQMTQSLVLAQKQLETQLDEINRSNVSLEKFAYIVSHDLKAPLNSISSLADIIISENSNKLNPDGVKMLGMLQSKVKQMHSLITGILDYSRVDHTNAAIERVDLNEIVHHVIENLSPPSKVNIEVVSKLPCIEFERILILQVFQNLISNAIKYSYRTDIQIKIGHEEEPAFFKFFVSDNGMGIDEKFLTKIFDLFTTLQPKGSDSTGIGLAIVKKIIENKGGSIYAMSKVREGATFNFTLPRA